ncbi:MAG: adenosylhomocysteinase [Thermotogae bacterium]|nr:adenosylhomocysteinase [Thermotogota bacterium]
MKNKFSQIELGMMKIEWAKQRMKLLEMLEKEYEIEKPLNGITVAMSIHLEAKTANLALSLKKIGANVVVTGSNPLSTQDDVAMALENMGIKVFARRTHDVREYRANLMKTIDEKPDLIIDDGADLTVLLHTERMDLLDGIIGASEETTTGLKRMRALEREGKLRYPVMAVNDAKMKYLFDNRYGTGQSTWDSLMRNTNVLVAGKSVLVCGYGWCGRGIAMRAKGLSAKVMVSEVDPIRAIEALLDGFELVKSVEGVKKADFVITATGNRDVISEEHFKVMKDGCILANAGHFNVEIAVEKLEKIAISKREVRPNVVEYRFDDGRKVYLIGEGRLVNLAAADGHPIEIMDISFSVQFLSLIHLLKNRDNLKPRVYRVPDEIDLKIARMKLEVLGLEIDELSDEQRRYLESY